MEITFEPEDSDIIVGFEPEFAVASNCTDIRKVRWKLQDGTHSRTVAGLLHSTPEYEHTATRLLPIV
jgi:hypothetical protein